MAPRNEVADLKTILFPYLMCAAVFKGDMAQLKYCLEQVCTSLSWGIKGIRCGLGVGSSLLLSSSSLHSSDNHTLPFFSTSYPSFSLVHISRIVLFSHSPTLLAGGRCLCSWLWPEDAPAHRSQVKFPFWKFFITLHLSFSEGNLAMTHFLLEQVGIFTKKIKNQSGPKSNWKEKAELRFWNKGCPGLQYHIMLYIGY